MAPKRKLYITKIPLPYAQTYKPIDFQPMPQLYLELLENKNKVKEELRDQSYEPRWDNNFRQHLVISAKEVNTAAQDFKRSLLKDFTSENDVKDIDNLKFDMLLAAAQQPYVESYKETYKRSPGSSREDFARPYQDVISREGSPHSFSKYVAEDVPKSRSRSGGSSDVGSRRSTVKFTKVGPEDDDDPYATLEDYKVDVKRTDDDDDRRDERRDEDRRDDRREERRDERRDDDGDRYSRKREEDDDDAIGRFLAADIPSSLGKSSQSVYSASKSATQTTYTSSSSYNSGSSSTQQSRPMGLDDINRMQANSTRVLNLSSSSKSEHEREERRSELLYKLKKLKRLYPAAEVPEFGPYTDLETLEREFTQQSKHLHIESNVENYKRYLQMGFGVMEYLVHRFLQFEEIQGFAAEQMIRMNQYDKILYELGEKYQTSPDDPGWPPEVKLMGLVVFNAVVFVFMKMLVKGAGNSMMANVVGSVAYPPRDPVPQQPKPAAAASSQPQQSKRKAMQAPDDIEKLFG